LGGASFIRDGDSRKGSFITEAEIWGLREFIYFGKIQFLPPCI
jgi:hypothetical protein